ncbi:MAG TPA: CHASE4 domain-containing protein [Myxococcota bacterium]
MPLGKKIIIVLLAVGALSVFFTSAALRTLVYPTFDALQTRMVESDVARVQQALDALGSVLDAANRDWSQWDDTYIFVQDQNEAYARNNLDHYSFFELGAHLILMYDADGRLLWSRFTNSDEIESLPLESLLFEPLAPDDPLIHYQGTGSHLQGLLTTRMGPMIVASRPILTSLGKGPIAGALVFGRLIDDAQIAALERQTKVSFALVPLETEPLAPEDIDAVKQLAPGKSHYVMGESLQFAYRLIRTLDGAPAYLLRIDTPREIAAVGYSALALAALLFSVTALFPLAATWLSIRRMVVRPVCGLTRHMLEMRGSRDLTRRIALNRNDEIGTLADQFDSLTGDLERAQREMEASRDAALEVAKLKSEFLASVSHEIRTPMNGVIGMTDLLLETPLTQRQREFAQTIQSSVDGLLAIVNDIVDFSKLEAQSVELEQREFRLGALVEESLHTFAGSARARGLALACRVSPDADALYRGDSNRLRQVLLNLIGNALKFTAEGEIEVGAALASRDGDTRRIRFEVRDTGIGIEARHCARIFESFARADGSSTRAHGGTGLGLAICQHLVEMMDGEIGVESEVGAGSTFWFVVPLEWCGEAPACHRTPAPIDPSAPSHLCGRVLLAEDNPVNQQVALAVLEALGCEVEVACDGVEALEALERARYGAVLMDCEMPNMDGFEATRRIRCREAEAGDGARIPIIALTAHTVGGAREKCLDADMDGYLSKPFRRSDLFEALRPWLGEATPNPRPQAATESVAVGVEASAAPEPEDAEDPLDRAVLQTLRALQPADGTDLLARLVGLYRESSAELLESLSDGVERGDPRAIQQAAHALKSSSLNVGARTLGALCKQLEAAGRSGEIAGAKDLFARIGSEHARALEALELAAAQ